SRNLERMGKRGWLAVRPGEDNRTHVVELTAKGTKLLQDAYPLWRKAQAEAARRMGEEGLAALHTLTEKLGGGEAGFWHYCCIYNFRPEEDGSRHVAQGEKIMLTALGGSRRRQQSGAAEDSPVSAAGGPGNDPRSYFACAVTRDGGVIEIRAVRPDDTG